MTHRAARFLTRLYPPKWRARYGEEFQAFLGARHVRAIETLNIAASALYERLAGSLVRLLFICVGMIASGGALYIPVGGAPLPQAINVHRAFWLCWALIEASSLVIVAIGVVAIAPVVFGIVRSRRPDVVKRLLWPAVTGFLMIVVLAIYTAVPGSRLPSWVGNTLICVGVFSERVGSFLGYIIAHSNLRRSLGRGRRLVLAMASWIVVASLIAAGYGWVFRYSTTNYPEHAPWFGGPLWLLALTYEAVRLRLDFREIE